MSKINVEKIANKIAKSLKADSGDIPVYFNVYDLFDFFKLDKSLVKKLTTVVENEIFDGGLYKKWQDELRGKLKNSRALTHMIVNKVVKVK